MAELVQLRSFFRGTRESIKLSNQCILILADQGFGYFGVLGKFAMEAWLADRPCRIPTWGIAQDIIPSAHQAPNYCS